MSVNNDPKYLDPTSLNFGGAIDEQEAQGLNNENCLCVFTNKVLKGTADHSRALYGRATIIGMQLLPKQAAEMLSQISTQSSIDETSIQIARDGSEERMETILKQTQPMSHHLRAVVGGLYLTPMDLGNGYEKHVKEQLRKIELLINKGVKLDERDYLFTLRKFTRRPTTAAAQFFEAFKMLVNAGPTNLINSEFIFELLMESRFAHFEYLFEEGIQPKLSIEQKKSLRLPKEEDWRWEKATERDDPANKCYGLGYNNYPTLSKVTNMIDQLTEGNEGAVSSSS